VLKIGANIWATSVKKKTARVNNHPSWARKFAQSGHPVPRDGGMQAAQCMHESMHACMRAPCSPLCRNDDQGDQIAQFFDHFFTHWAIAYFGQFVENYRSSPFLSTAKLMH
jgi:hypothetical protein